MWSIWFYSFGFLKTIDSKPFYFWNRCRKEADPTCKDSMNFLIDSESIGDSNSESFYVGSVSFRHWFQNKLTWVWTTVKWLVDFVQKSLFMGDFWPRYGQYQIILNLTVRYFKYLRSWEQDQTRNQKQCLKTKRKFIGNLTYDLLLQQKNSLWSTLLTSVGHIWKKYPETFGNWIQIYLSSWLLLDFSSKNGQKFGKDPKIAVSDTK